MNMHFVSHLPPIGQGSQRTVYVHPADPGLIIKIPIERYVQRRAGIGGKWYKRPHKKFLRTRHFLMFLREIREQFAVRAAEGRIPPYMQEIVGFVETDLGMGLVARAVRTSDGELAPTLKSLVMEGKFDDRMRAHLDEFLAWLLGSTVIVCDLNLGNLVYGSDPAHGPVFVAIDGLGDKNIIPFNSISKRMNLMAKRRRINRLNRQIESLSEKSRQADDPSAGRP